MPAVSMTKSMFFKDSGTASASRSELAALINFSMKSRMVSHKAVKVGSVVNGVRCCRNTFPNRVAALVLVSSMAVLSPGWLGTNRSVSSGNKTFVNAASHSSEDNFWRSWKSRALCNVVNALVRM